jgi:PAP2 superfamily
MKKVFAYLFLFACFVFSQGAVSAKNSKTIISYPEGFGVDQSWVVHKSVFHSGKQDEADAIKIIDAWRVSAISIPWTQLQLDLHIKHKVSPSRASRGLALVHVAMHDAYQMSMGLSVDDRRLAVSMAAAQVLGYLFVAEEKRFERIVQFIAAKISKESDLKTVPSQGINLGRLVAGKVIERAEQDGAQKGWNGLRLEYYGEDRYYGPGTWEPTPPYYYYPPDEPFAPSWKAWVLTDAGEFRPKPLPYGSADYMKDLREVIEVGKKLTAEELKIAKFWVDGHGTVTPPGHWNQISLSYVENSKFDDGQVLALFANLNMALADAFLAAWDAKYYYWTVRPITAARYLLGEDFKPALLTPPFPSYVSGHAAFSGAAAQILSSYFPVESKKIWSLARQAAHSRLLAGIHFRHDNEDGLTLGAKVAAKVLMIHRSGEN